MQVLASIERTEAEVDGARIAVTDTRIAAPIDGVVTSRHAEEGMLASPGMPLLTIEDDSGWEIEAAVPESQMGAIRVGQELPVRIDLVGRVVEGTVTEIVPAADPLTRTFTVRLALRIPAELDTPLRSGSFGRVAISEGEREAIVIPSEAIVRRGQLDGVYMVGDDDRAFFRLVETRRRADDSDTEILAGLRDGDRIVTQTAPSLTDGVRIDILGGSDTP
jgi:RND family efflux transporter MFP subunit